LFHSGGRMHAGAYFFPQNFSPHASALPRSGSVQPFAGDNADCALSFGLSQTERPACAWTRAFIQDIHSFFPASEALPKRFDNLVIASDRP
jgi:hypothetical protein